MRYEQIPDGSDCSSARQTVNLNQNLRQNDDADRQRQIADCFEQSPGENKSEYSEETIATANAKRMGKNGPNLITTLASDPNTPNACNENQLRPGATPAAQY